MNDIVDLVLKHLEQIKVVESKIEEGESSYKITDYFKGLVEKSLQNSDMQKAPNPLLSSIILSYLYCVGDESSHAYELQHVASVIYYIYTYKGGRIDRS